MCVSPSIGGHMHGHIYDKRGRISACVPPRAARLGVFTLDFTGTGSDSIEIGFGGPSSGSGNEGYVFTLTKAIIYKRIFRSRPTDV